MKKTIFLLILSFFLISPLNVLAVGDHSISVEDVLAEIRESQSITENSAINCEQIDDEQFEELGEAVMSLMHPNSEEHEMMDNMMGGEGSQSLETAHIMMGQQYIGCASGSSGMMGSAGMMGGGMMSAMGMMSGSPLKNWAGGGNIMNTTAGWGGFGWVSMILLWTLMILGIIWLVKNLIIKK